MGQFKNMSRGSNIPNSPNYFVVVSLTKKLT